MRKWIPFLIVAAAFAASIAVYPRLPEEIPTHWNLRGEVDDTSSRVWGAFGLPLILAAIPAIFWLLRKIDPRRANYAKFSGTFETLIITTMAFMLGLHLLVLAKALGQPVSMERVMPMGIGALLIVIGNLLPRMRPNWFVGVRTPWTLSSDRVWERTHRVTGHLMVGIGFGVLLIGLLLPGAAFAALIASSVGLAVVTMGYSYYAYKQDQAGQVKSSPGSASSP